MADARSPEALLRHVELAVGRRFDGVLQGERRGRRPGPGDEPALTRSYEPGDDVRWVDWALTARQGALMVRVPTLEPVLTAWALVDLSPSMLFGTCVRTKLELAREAVAGLGTILRRRGDRLGVIASRAGGLDVVRPPRSDRRALAAAVRAVDGAVAEAAQAAPDDDGERTPLERSIAALGRIARHRGLVAVFSDFPLRPGLEQALGALARRHEVIAVEVRDPRERDIPQLGPVILRDMETGRVVEVDTSDRRFQEGFANATRRDDADRKAVFRRVGARHVVVNTNEDWILPMARALQRPGPVRRAA